MKLKEKNLEKKQVDMNFLEQTNDNYYGFKFTDFTGIGTPIRLNRNFDVECFSINGVNCAWVFFYKYKWTLFINKIDFNYQGWLQ